MEIRVKKSIGLSQDATDILRLEFIEVALIFCTADNYHAHFVE